MKNPITMKMEYDKLRYKKPEVKDKVKIDMHKRRTRNQEWIRNYKSNKECSMCGYKEHQEILQFHHTGEKKMSVSNSLNHSLENVKKEIEKCILLCPNCHMWHHFGDGQY